MRIGILGGGISGIALQRFIRNHETEVLEASDRIGGLCRTVTTPRGFKYDIGGHIFFTRHDDVRDFVLQALGDNVVSKRRDSRILYDRRLVKYPFANGFGALDREEVLECLLGFLQKDIHWRQPDNLKEWFYFTYGKGITEKNLLPYTEKVWKMPADRLSCGFVSRIPPPPIEDVAKTALGIDTEGYTEQLNFHYPEKGGYGSVVRAVADHDRANIITDFPVSNINWDGQANRWTVTSAATSRARTFDRIVVAMPLHAAVRAFKDSAIPWTVRDSVNDLVYNSLRVVFVATTNHWPHEDCFGYRTLPSDRPNALYVADKDILFHRVCPTNPYGLCDGHHSGYACEITCREGDPIYGMPDSDLSDIVVRQLASLGITGARTTVVETHVTREDYAYPVYDLRYDANMASIRAFFSRIGVGLLGRSGNFEYINSDECIRHAMLMARHFDQEA